MGFKMSRIKKKPAEESTRMEESTRTEEALAGESAGPLSALITDPKAVARRVADAKSSAVSMDRKEFRVSADEDEKIAWFRSETSIGLLHIHRLRVSGRFRTEACRANVGRCPLCDHFNAQMVFVYDLVDMTGYTSTRGRNAGKRQKDFACYYLASNRRNHPLKNIYVKNGPLNEKLMSVQRVGSGVDTVHIWTIKEEGYRPPSNIRGLKAFNHEEDWLPLSEEAMEQLVMKADPESND